jgi:predicted histone-like DNA-binding protein
MAVYYKVVSKKPGLSKPDSATKYYPVLTGRNQADIREVCDLLSEASTVTPGDVRAVLEGFIRLIPHLLMDGRTVKLEGFGTFNLHCSAVGQTNPDNVTLRDIRGIKMSFLPDKEIKRKLKGTKFKKKTGSS